MTRDEWLTCDNPTSMLASLRPGGRVSKRKMRLFAVACCARSQPFFPCNELRLALEFAERFADGKATNDEQLSSADTAAADYWYSEGVRYMTLAAPRRPLVVKAAEAAEWAAKWVAHGMEGLAWDRAAWREWVSGGKGRPYKGGGWTAVARAAEGSAQALLLRDIFDPWLPALAPPVLAWNNSTVVKLARRISDEKHFEDMPILADALEEAGAPQEMVQHCRNGKVHARGCWALDYLLGKE